MLNDQQKAKKIGLLMAQSCDDPLTGQQLALIANIVWPESKANHNPFAAAYVSEAAAINADLMS